jgi:hypothetical protein
VYGDTSWEDLDNMVFESGDGRCELIGIDEHFTGLPSQDYQSTYLIRELGPIQQQNIRVLESM